MAQKPYTRAVAILDGDGDARTRVRWAASEIAGFVERTFPPELWARQQRLVERVTRVSSPDGAIPATVTRMTDGEIAAVESEIRATAAALHAADPNPA
jgi:hypothetical protein